MKYVFIFGLICSGIAVALSANPILHQDYLIGFGMFFLGDAGVFANLWGLTHELD